MNRIAVVIPMYGKAEYTTKCIEMTLENAGVGCEIVVVDDGSPEPFSYSHNRVFIHRLEQNSGFTNACNEGILWAQMRGYDYVHLLNNDTEPSKDFIKHLLDAMADENVHIASSVRFNPQEDGSTLVELYGLDLIRGYQCVTKPEDLKMDVLQCNWVPLCSSLVRMSLIRYLGLLDKRMRTHSSDLDYCLRAKINGFNIVVVPQSQVLHHHEVTTKANGISPQKDQMVLLEKLAGLHYAEFMKKIPLDCENKTYGKLDFTVYQK